MLTSVHVADIGATGAIWRPPKPEKVAGLHRADGGVVARLTSSAKPSLETGRVAMVARWESESSLDAFLATTPFGDGWTARCEPIRAVGEWPGVEPELPSARAVEREEPLIVVGQAKVNLTKTVNFYKFMAEASGTAAASDALLWGCSFIGAPYVGTVTMWSSPAAMVDAMYNTRSGYGNATAPLESEMAAPNLDVGAYGEGGHRGAMTASTHHNFYSSWAYVRLRPLRLTGAVQGRDPLTTKVFG